jgi:hypothetical protein
MGRAKVAEIASEDLDAPIRVSRTQVRAAQELIWMRGEQAVHPIVRRVAGLEYERDLLNALQRHHPAGAVVRRAVPPGAAGASAYFRLDDGQRLVIFEVDSGGRALGTDSANQSARMRDAVLAADTRPVAVVLVSRAGFTADAERVAAAAGIRLLEWVDRDDDAALAAVVRETFDRDVETAGEESSA